MLAEGSFETFRESGDIPAPYCQENCLHINASRLSHDYVKRPQQKANELRRPNMCKTLELVAQRFLHTAS